jgi:hypothetical protein
MTTPEQSKVDEANETEAAKSRPERLRRPEPQRSDPIRNVTTYFRDSKSWSDGAAQPDAGRDPSDVLDDVITQGVKLGYRVIDEHIRLGRRTAEGLRTAGDRKQKGGTESDVEELIERVQRVYQDVGALCFDALDVVSRSPALLRWFTRREAGDRDASGAAPAGDGRGDAGPFAAPAPVSVEIASARRVLVSLNLADPAVASRLPLVHALHACDPAFPPLTDIGFRRDPASPGPVLQLRVPDRQPAALYTGVVVDRETNEPRGTLSVRVFESV